MQRKDHSRGLRETLSEKEKMMLRNRKSEIIEKRTPPPTARRKSEVQKTPVTVSPLRRSERARNITSPATSPLDPSKGSSSCKSSESRSESSGSKAQQKKRKRQGVKKLTIEAREVSEDEEYDGGCSSKSKTGILNAKAYRALLKKPNTDCREKSKRINRSNQEGDNGGGGKIGDCFKKSHVDNKEDVMSDCHEELNRMDVSTHDNNDGGKISECFRGSHVDCIKVSKDGILLSEDAEAKEMRAESVLNGPVKELSENNATLGSVVPSDATNHESSAMLERHQSDGRGEETSQMLVSKNSRVNENLMRSCVWNDKGEKLISYKREGTAVDMHSNVSATLVDDENCNLIVDTDTSRLSSDPVGTGGSCSKRIRRILLSDVQRDRGKLTNNVDQPSSKSEAEKSSSRNIEGESGDPAERPQGSNVEYENIRKQQRSLHLLLKPKIAKLCGILLLPENVKNVVDKCLEYIMNSRQICTEPVSILQAFQLSLCWIAASLLNHKLDFEASLMLAKCHLNFDCKKDMVDEIYSRLWELKEDFLSHIGNSNVTDSPKTPKSSMAQKVKLADKEISTLSKEIRRCENQFEKRKLNLMQQQEKRRLEADFGKEMADLESKHRIERAAVHCCSPNDAIRTERLKVFNSEYEKSVRELKRQHEIRLKDLIGKQSEATKKFQEPGAQVELLNQVASEKLGAGVEYLLTCNQDQTHNGLKSVAPVPDHVAEGKSSYKYNVVDSVTRSGTGIGLSEAADTNSPVVVLCSSPVELQTALVKHAGASGMEIMTSENGPISRTKCHNIDENEHDGQGNIFSKHSSSREQCSGGVTSMEDNGEGLSCESRNGCGQEVLLSSNGEIYNGETSDVPRGEVARAVCKTSNSTDDQDEVPSGQEKLDGILLRQPVCGLNAFSGVKEGFNDGVKNIAFLNSKSPEKHIPSVTTMCMSNCENAAQIHETDGSNGCGNAVTLNSPSSDERIASLKSNKVDDSNGSNNAVTLNSTLTHSLKNVTAASPPLSMEQMSRGAAQVSVSDREFSRLCGTARPSIGPDADAITLSNQPSLEKENPDRVSLSTAAGQIPVEVPETSHEGATVSVLEREAPGGVPNTVDSSPSNGLATISLLNPPSLNQQIPDGVSLSIPDGQIPAIEPEARHELTECELTESVTVDRSTTAYQQEGVHRSVTESTLSQETPVSRSVDPMETLQQVQPLSTVTIESQTDQDVAREMQNSSVSSPVDIALANQSNHVSLTINTPEQVQQLPSADFSIQDLSLPFGTEIVHQTINEDALSSHAPESTTEIPNQAVEQPASDLDRDSRLHQIVGHAASDLVPDPPIINNPIEHATQSASGIVQPLCRDPLRNELERICKLKEHCKKTHDDKQSQLKSDFEKEFEELRRKYEIRSHEIEVKFQQSMKNLDTLYKSVLVSKALADAFRCKCLDLKVYGASGVQQGASFTQQLSQLSRQQNGTWPSVVVRPSSFAPLQSSYTITNSQPTLPPIHAAYNTSGILSGASPRPPQINSASSPVGSGNIQASGIFSGASPRPSQINSTSLPIGNGNIQATSGIFSSASPRPPQINSTSSPVGNGNIAATSGNFSSSSPRPPQINSTSSPLGSIQAVGDIRAPAPHLQPFRPSTSVPASSHSTVPHGMPRQPAPNMVPLTLPSLSHRLPTQLPRTSRTDPRGHGLESTGGLSTPNLSTVDLQMDANSQSSLNLPNGQPRVSDLASLNLSRFGTGSSMQANSTHQATSSDVVCLSDDE